MALDKITASAFADDAITADKINLSDTFAFTGTVTGAGTQELVTSANVTGDGSSASIVVDNCFTSAYTAYRVLIWDMMNNNGTDAIEPRWLYRTGGSSGSDYTGSTYNARCIRGYSGHSTFETDNSDEAAFYTVGFTATTIGSADSNAGLLDFRIYNTNGSQVKCTWDYVADHSGTDPSTIWNYGGGALSQTTPITGFKFFSNSSKAFTHYRLRVFGIK